MDGKPLTMTEAWRVYDRMYEDDRVTFISEPPEVDKRFREKATGRTASPKVWADAWLLAVAHAAESVPVTFDKALASRGALCLLPKEEKPSRRQASQRSS
jgi:predicted nucleic acid-binding protein